MRLHFIAIGGSVMHQLAISLSAKGYTITGSDDEIFEPAYSNLGKAGLLPKEFGWHPEKISKDLDAVILGMHARQDNPEIQAALNLGLKIYSFPEYIYQESREKMRVAVGGSHGKTTTTSMIMHVLKKAGRDFDYLVGAKLEGFVQSVKISNADTIICEADEYPASTLEKRPKFHFLFPQIAVLTGIAWDHINVFPTFDFYLEQFRIFISTIQSKGCLVYNTSDDTLKDLVDSTKRDDLRYYPYNLPTNFIEKGKTSIMIGNIKTDLKVFGNHNLLNLTAAHLVCRQLGIDDKTFADAISTFAGAAKRLEVLHDGEDIKIYRDFAHAPSKVKASVDAIKQQFPGQSIHAILELHTFSSLNEQFLSEYAGSMDAADSALVYFSEHALQLKRLPPLDPQKIKDGFQNDKLIVVSDPEKLRKYLNDVDKGNAVFLFMSSGNFDGLNILPVFSL